MEYKTLAQARDLIKDLIKEYGNDATIQLEYAPYSDSEKQYLYVYSKRLETYAEMKKRLEQEAHLAAAQEKRDRALFERLSKKFGRL